MKPRTRAWPVSPLLMAWSALLAPVVTSTAVPSADASVISTTDATAIAAFKAGRVVLDFDELVVPSGPCYVPLDPNQYAPLGIVISARADGSDQTHLAQLPGCGHFGTTLTPPNIIGGGTGPGSLAWRETVRFDFPAPADAIGANSDWSGSRTTLTAHRADGSVIASVSGNEGDFMGIAEPGIAYAVWKWDFDQSVAGFSLDNVTFSLPSVGVEDRPSTVSFEVGPNPFHTETWVRWSTAVWGRVGVSVYDVAGQRVASLLDEQRPPGRGAVYWRATDDRGERVPPGIYFVRIDIPGQTATRRVVRIR